MNTRAERAALAQPDRPRRAEPGDGRRDHRRPADRRRAARLPAPARARPDGGRRSRDERAPAVAGTRSPGCAARRRLRVGGVDPPGRQRSTAGAPRRRRPVRPRPPPPGETLADDDHDRRRSPRRRRRRWRRCRRARSTPRRRRRRRSRSRSGTACGSTSRRRPDRAHRRVQRQPGQGPRRRCENQGGYKQTIDKYVQSSQDEPARPRDVPGVHGPADRRLRHASIPVGACIEASGFDTSPFLPAGAARRTRPRACSGRCRSTSAIPVLYYNKVDVRGRRPRSRPTRRSRSTSCARRRRRSSTPARRRTGSPSTRGVDSGGGWFLEQWFARAGEPYADNGNGRLGAGDPGALRRAGGRRADDAGAVADHRRAGRHRRRQPERRSDAAQAGRPGRSRRR